MIAWQDADAAGELRFRMNLFRTGSSGMCRGLKQAGVSTGLGGDCLRIGAVKYASAAPASERNIRMSTPFQACPDDYGILTMAQEEKVRSMFAHRWFIDHEIPVAPGLLTMPWDPTSR